MYECASRVRECRPDILDLTQMYQETKKRNISTKEMMKKRSQGCTETIQIDGGTFFGRSQTRFTQFLCE